MITSIATIESSCQSYARARSALERKIQQIERERERILIAHRAELRALCDQSLAAYRDLESNLIAGRQLFLKPKTRTFHGITVGYEKQRDKVEIPPEEILIPRIETLLKSKAAGLLETTKRIIKDAFKRLPKTDLQSLGVKYISGADEPIIRSESKSDIEKLASSYLSDPSATSAQSDHQQQEAA